MRHQPASQSIRPCHWGQRIFAVCSKLAAFIIEQGPRPDEDEIFDQTSGFGKDHMLEFMKKCQEELVPWDNKISAGYWRRFKEDVLNLRHELVEMGQTDDDLDKALMDVDKAPDRQYAKHLRMIVERLRVLASKLD
jgi:hypothetical protein